MSTAVSNGLPKSKSVPAPPNPMQPINKPPAVPPPPIPPPTPLKNMNKSSPVKPHHYQSKSLRSHSTNIVSATQPSPQQQKQLNGHSNPTKLTQSSSEPVSKWHQFGTFLLGTTAETKQNDPEYTPTLLAVNPTESIMCILSAPQRDILSHVIITILSNAKKKKLPNFGFLGLRKSSCDGLYSSESDAEEGEASIADDNSDNNNSQNNDQDQTIEDSDEADFVDTHVPQEMQEHSNSQSGNSQSADKESVARIVLSQKEKLLLMTSISKYVETQIEMDTIHRACFNLWKDWYRCYGTITNQFQSAFMAVCESLLGNVDSRALAREPPLIPVHKDKDIKHRSIEAITYHLSTQISTLKHAFAVEQLNTVYQGQKSLNVPQIIDAMEPNVWCVVKHIITEYFKSPYWIQCKYTLFNLFLDQYETVHRKLDREFISTSSFGVYTLICQLSKDKDKNKPSNELELFHLDRDPEVRIHEHEPIDQDEEQDNAYSNQDLLQTLNWYYALCRLETLLSNKRVDHLTQPIYELYEPMFAPVFEHFKHDNHVLCLIQSLVDDTDYVALKTRYELLLKKETIDKKKEKEPFVSLLSRVIDSCMSWICRDLYPNYRKSEFCMLLTQLLADPGHFKTKKEESRSTRIIRLHERFSLPCDQPLVNSFSCAWDSGKFLYHGRIYFFKDYLCFYSNMLVIRDAQQKFLLPVTEIKTVARKVTAWVFNNAIEIQMKDGRTFTFRTFMKRDNTFELLQKLINGQVDWDAVEKQRQKELEKELDEGDKEGEDNDNEKEKEKDKESKDKEKEKEPSTNKSVMSDLSGLVKSAKTAIDVSSSKLLSTDAKLLLQSKHKSKRRPMVSIADEPPIVIPMALTKTRSAPSSPMLSKKAKNKKSSSDSEMPSCDEGEEEKEDHTHLEREEQEEETIEETYTKEELEAKCERLNSMHSKWIYKANNKVEKDFEVIVEFEFKNIGVDEFWDKFWSNDAIFSPVDWLQNEPLNSKIKSNEWKPQQIDGEEWYTRHLSCVTKLEDMPAFFPKSISHCTSQQEFRYCHADEYFYVVHKIIRVNDIPFADCYNTHQKTEFRQSATVMEDEEDKPSICLSTHCKMYFAVEWTKSTWLKSPIRSRTLISIKQDCAKYCDEINRRIITLHKPLAEPKPGKEVYVKSITALSDVAEMDDDDSEIVQEIEMTRNENDRRDHLESAYDFVFRIGHQSSLIRCECKCNMLMTVMLVILCIIVILSGLYALTMVITLISSVGDVLTSSAQYIEQLSTQMKAMNHCPDMNILSNDAAL